MRQSDVLLRPLVGPLGWPVAQGLPSQLWWPTGHGTRHRSGATSSVTTQATSSASMTMPATIDQGAGQPVPMSHAGLHPESVSVIVWPS